MSVRMILVHRHINASASVSVRVTATATVSVDSAALLSSMPFLRAHRCHPLRPRHRGPLYRIQTMRFTLVPERELDHPTVVTNTPSRILLIDTSTLLFRAHHGFANRRLLRSDGVEVSALYGLCSTLLSLIDAYRPTHILCALDVPGSRGTRQSLLPEYKLNRDARRDPNIEALTWQMTHVTRVINCMGIMAMGVEGHEADDVIATYVQLAKQHTTDSDIDQGRGSEVSIVSMDKDFIPLLHPSRPKVSLLRFQNYSARTSTDTDTGTITTQFGMTPFTADQCQSRYNIPVSQFVDYLALVGDVSDNIPGVPSIGPKTAASLLNQWGSLEAIIEAAATSKIANARIAGVLVKHSSDVLVWRQVATLNTHLTVPSLDSLTFRGLAYARHAMNAVFDEFEFESLKERASAMTERDGVRVSVTDRLPVITSASVSGCGTLVYTVSNEEIEATCSTGMPISRYERTTVIVSDKEGDDPDPDPDAPMTDTQQSLAT